MNSPILSVENVSISFGGIKAVDDVNFEVKPSEVLSIIGPNGAGKTTLFNVVSGLYQAHSGSIKLNGEEVSGLAPHLLARRGLARTFQNLQIFHHLTSLENVMVGGSRWERSSLLGDMLGSLRVARQDEQAARTAQGILARFGLAGLSGTVASELPYGSLKRLEIARALAARPSVLLLDEPAAGCNEAETQELGELISEIAAAGVAIVLIEHDMRMVMGISHRILVLNQGGELARGSPHEIRHDPRVIEAYLGQQAAQEIARA